MHHFGARDPSQFRIAFDWTLNCLQYFDLLESLPANGLKIQGCVDSQKSTGCRHAREIRFARFGNAVEGELCQVPTELLGKF
jgi:hypothetical protein